MLVPQDAAPGKYVLQWRWDCECVQQPPVPSFNTPGLAPLTAYHPALVLVRVACYVYVA
eukprot:COSAG05_NODE_724_length_7726_cov_2.123771_6_plen_58_part_01